MLPVLVAVADQHGCRTGRVQITLITKLLDVALLVCMAGLPTRGESIWLLIIAHVMRSSFANCNKYARAAACKFPCHMLGS